LRDDAKPERADTSTGETIGSAAVTSGGIDEAVDPPRLGVTGSLTGDSPEGRFVAGGMTGSGIIFLTYK